MGDTEYLFFEGPEKKVEVVTRPGGPSLRGFSRENWQQIVRLAAAQVLSVRSNSHFDAYLLSESSLFVFDDHATMITCGRTRLVDAVLGMIEMIGRENVALLVYERKNEHFPSLQHSTFSDDAALLNQRISGRALRFGVEHAHCIEMYVSGLNYAPDPTDVTLEVLMHGLNPERAAAFRGGGGAQVASPAGLDSLVLGEAPFEIDQFGFDPAGYSMNALCGATYYTVHVTPEAEGSYASFETNCDFRADPSAQVSRVVSAFGPESFDVFAFAPSPGSIECEVDGYLPRKQVRAEACGYEVSFRSFFRPRGLEEAGLLVVR